MQHTPRGGAAGQASHYGQHGSRGLEEHIEAEEFESARPVGRLIESHIARWKARSLRGLERPPSDWGIYRSSIGNGEGALATRWKKVEDKHRAELVISQTTTLPMSRRNIVEVGMSCTDMIYGAILGLQRRKGSLRAAHLLIKTPAESTLAVPPSCRSVRPAPPSRATLRPPRRYRTSWLPGHGRPRARRR